MLSNIAPDPALSPLISAAIAATKESSPDLWVSLCEAVDPRKRGRRGGTFALRPNFEGSIERVLLECEWSPYDLTGSIPPACRAFRTYDMQGYMGVVELKTLSPYLMVRLQASDLDGGLYEAGVFIERGNQVPFVTIVLGPDLVDIRKSVWSFFPGPPLRPSSLAMFERIATQSPEVPEYLRLYASEMTVFEAMNHGMEWARCLNPPAR